MSQPAATSLLSTVSVDVRAGDSITRTERECAQAMIGAVLTHHRVTDGARVRLTRAGGPGGLVLVQANLRVFGAGTRIQVVGRSAPLAIAAGAARLDRQIRRLTTAWERWPWPDLERRSLGLPGAGEIVRLKAYRLQVGMPCQANAVMDAMDYDVHLFTDAETGEDAIVYRAGPTGVRLARQHTMRPPAMPVALPLTINPRRTATLTPAEAATRLGEYCLPFMFFTDRASGRGSLLYRRYDGDLGLVRRC